MAKKPKEPWKTAGGFSAWFEFMFAMGGNPITGIRKPKKKK